jgi:hypothetical protein
VGVEQRAQRGGWVQEKPVGGRVGDEEHPVAGHEAAGAPHADRMRRYSSLPTRTDAAGQGTTRREPASRVRASGWPGPQCRARSTARSASRPYRSRIARPYTAPRAGGHGSGGIGIGRAVADLDPMVSPALRRRTGGRAGTTADVTTSSSGRRRGKVRLMRTGRAQLRLSTGTSGVAGMQPRGVRGPSCALSTRLPLTETCR